MENTTAVRTRSECAIRRSCHKFACVFFGLVLACGVVWAADETQWSQQLAAELAELKAQGIPLTMAELVSKDVPDEQNAAPLYMQVFHVHWDTERRRTGDQEIGGISDEEANMVADYLKPENREFIAAAVHELFERTQVQSAMKALRIASLMPHAVFPVNWDWGLGALFPHLTKFRQATRLVLAYALMLHEQGQTDEALEWCQVNFRMSQHAASEPIFISQLLAIAMQQMTLETVEEIIANQPLEAATATSFADFLGEVDLREAYTRAIIGEMTLGRYIFEQLRHYPAAGREIAASILGHQHSDLQKYCSEAGRSLREFDELIYLRAMRLWIEASELPSREVEAAWDHAQTEIDAAGPGAILARALVHVFHKPDRKIDLAQARIDVARIAFALKAHKHIHGAYPEDLAELQKGLSWQLPKDVFAGEDFAYQIDAEGFVLHSEARDDLEGLLPVEWTAEN